MNIVDQQTFRDAMSCMGAAVNMMRRAINALYLVR